MRRSVGKILPALFWALAALPAAAADASAQAQADLVDRVVAIVGDTAILQSEIQEALFRLQAQQGTRLPNDRQQMRDLARQVLHQQINEALVVIHARRDGLTVSDAEVNDEVEDRIATIKRQFPSEMAFQQALVAAGFTPAEFRLQMIEQTRAELLTQRYLGQRVSELKPVPISEQEVRERFELMQSALGPKPASVSFRQLVLIPRPSPDAELEAEAKAEQALSRARSGEDFGRLAHEYSEDPGSRDNDGELGWMRRGQLLPEFEDELFEMRPGEISDIVKTSVGYHVIKLQRVRGAERFASHILIRAEITAEDEALVERQAREAASALRAGADPDSISFLHHDKEEREVLSNRPQDQLPPLYRQNLQGANVGDVVGPLELPIPGLEISKWVVLTVLDISPGGEWELSDLRDRIRVELQQDKMLEQVIVMLRETTYVEAREDAVDQLADTLLGRLSTVLQ